MRQFFLFFIVFLGLFLVIDAVAFEGQNSADAWQGVKRLGQNFSSDVNGQIERIWR